MVRKFAALVIALCLFSISPAYARCYSDQCAEDRISAIVIFLPLTIWGIFVWSAFSQDMQGTDIRKNRNLKIGACLAFIPVWWLTTLLLK